MTRRLRPVGLGFTEDAPTRLVFTARASAAPDAVYRALAEEVTGWPSWFRAVTLARPTGGGGGREVRLMGGVRFQETVMAADPGRRYAYRVDETNVPGVRALLEEWLLTPADRSPAAATAPGTPGAGTPAAPGTPATTSAPGAPGTATPGTLVRWTFAADGPPAFRLALAASRPALGHSFRTAVRTLDARLAARTRS
ncbi:SRPBCC family protein [Streptomyces sp. AB3(2024)]|uniref:SRPBCC family protein n=1 Tax=Streptomyces sp. AB3(2024) TaxID=3317321 RepID=UPI0035A3CBAC